jgi:antitoxin VapB
MATQHRVKLSRSGEVQVVQIPKELELTVDEVLIRKVGDQLIVEPVPEKSLIELLDSWEDLEEEFPEIDDPPPDPVEI